MEVVIELPSPEATYELGERLGRAIEPGDFVGLSGELGAGKTLLVRGVASGLGVPAGQVQSPTFTLVNSYAGGRFPLHHADLYRIETADELYATGYFDLLEGAGALLVEWPELIPGARPHQGLDLRLERTSENSRRLQAVARGARAEGLLRSCLRP
ncbi:MAG: tRNA (adenosine(37)-N6)-threonylcarbamoyltransferase complex ATPase subunit type 1 TsaE [Myxococcales bacterium]